MPSITRKLEFDAGHRVHNHESKCNHLHGHRYTAEITVEAPHLDSLGRVVDFGVIKKLVGGWIDEHWDHNMLLNSKDPILRMQAIVEGSIIGGKELMQSVWAKKTPFLFREKNPTAENMVEVLFTQAVLLLPSPMRVTHVRLYETPNCWADYPGGIEG